MKIRQIIQSGVFLALSGYAVAQNQCGRADWSNVLYDYYPGHRAENPNSATIVGIRDSNGTPVIAVYKAGPESNPFFAEPQYFETNDNGKTWQVRSGDVPSNLPRVPYAYFQNPSAPQVLYRLMSDLGLYLRSDDGGKTWMLPRYAIEGKRPEEFVNYVAGTGFHLEVGIIAVDPANPRTVYAGIRVLPWPDSSGDLKYHDVAGVYRSADGGDHWFKFSDEILPFSLSWTGTSALGISPLNPNVLFAVGHRGIEKSEDGGVTWGPVGQVDLLEKRPLYRAETKSGVKMLGAPTVQEVHEFLFDPSADHVLYMLSNRGIFKTVDSGKSWRLLDIGFDEIDAITSVALNPTNSNQVFVGSRYGLFVSEDGGCRFRHLPSPGEVNNRASQMSNAR